VIYGIEDRPPLAEALPLAAQHLVAMLLGNITPPLLVAGALAISGADKTLLLQMVLLMAGVATVIQAYPVGPVGGKIPIIMGTSVAFVGGIIAIGRDFGLPAVFGACCVAALVEVALGFSINRLRRFFPPLVNSIVVMLIGLTLIPVGMDYAAGGKNSADYGSLTHLGIAAVVFVVTLSLHQFARGFMSYASMLIGVLVGYLLALAYGLIDFSAITAAPWFAWPRPLAFGFELHWTPIFIMAFIYVISTMETLGDIAGIVAVEGRDPTDQELRGGLVADGVMSSLAALMSAFPNTSYSQNVGLVYFTGIASRHITALGGMILIVMGLVPKVGALFATIPAAVIGGGGLIMFAMIFSSGAAIFHRSVHLNQRNLVILAVSLALGLACELRPEALANLPQWARSFFGAGLVTGGLTALLLNAIFPEEG
jgi:NCS2 family nucleobase:cation symporter-2